MPLRKIQLSSDNFYHVYSRSIAGFEIFRADEDFNRFILSMLYFNSVEEREKLSNFLFTSKDHLRDVQSIVTSDEKLVDICAFCIMPTHIHFLLKQLRDKGISLFMFRLLKSYSRYYNTSSNKPVNPSSRSPKQAKSNNDILQL